MITYPRKCKVCGYEANNPAMWGYHQRIHQPIPDGTLCEMGCGEPAKFTKTSGKRTCREISQQCPAYIQRHSVDVTRQWGKNEWSERRKTNAHRTRTETTEQRKARCDKQRATKRKKRLATESTYDQRKYNRAVLYHTKKTYEEFKEQINPDNLPIGKQEYHIDHIVSKFVGWMLGIPVDILCHHTNLQILHHKENSSKCHKCSLHPLDLLERVKASQSTIDNAQAKLHFVEHLL